jgi:CBS domain-containing protein
MKVKDIMTSNISTVNENANVSEAAQIMKNLNVGSVPVTKGNEPVGMVTDRDITIRNVADGGDGNSPVNQVMSGNLIYGTPDMSSEDAARLMAEKQVRRLPIVEKGNVVGIVSLGDLAVQTKSDMEAGKALSSISIPSKPEQNRNE